MSPDRDISLGVHDPIERLISRHLDGEITAAQQAELDRVLADDPAARAMLDEYRQNDLFAARALRTDLGQVKTSPARQAPRRLWLVATGAVLTAAAVIALSFLPIFNPPTGRLASNTAPVLNNVQSPTILPRFVDYRNVDLYPRQQFSDVRRDLIGFRGLDPNVIYLFERETQSTRIVPVSGDF